jgi:hypothetical protein
MTDQNPAILLRLSIQRALLDEVTDQLWSVTCGLSEKSITIRAYFSGVVTDEERETIQAVGAEVIADFPEGYMIEEHCLSVDDNIEQMLDFWAFRRARRLRADF